MNAKGQKNYAKTGVCEINICISRTYCLEGLEWWVFSELIFRPLPRDYICLEVVCLDTALVRTWHCRVVIWCYIFCTVPVGKLKQPPKYCHWLPHWVDTVLFLISSFCAGEIFIRIPYHTMFRGMWYRIEYWIVLRIANSIITDLMVLCTISWRLVKSKYTNPPPDAFQLYIEQQPLQMK
jgi:hypothetical protein